ncbi:MAG: TetR/AcrR family transcriptional regulator [Clostridia bacterium]|nr:TetR/AcrR family transcriptional regulator [Clostridia bacterium]
MMKDDQRVALTKRLLKEGLLRLMQDKPIDKIGVSELCKESGINRATFYRHYELPRDVLLNIGHDLFNGLRFDTWEIASVQDIAHYTDLVLNHIDQNADTLKILLKNHSDESLTQMINEYCDVIYRIKTPLNTTEIDAQSARLLSAYTIGGIYFLLREWLLGDVHKTPQEMSELMLQLLQDSSVIVVTKPTKS